MKISTCSCGNHLYFENSICLQCRSEVGWCPKCQAVTALIPWSRWSSEPALFKKAQAAGNRSGASTIPQGPFFRCANEGCGVVLKKCYNYAIEQVCNRCILVEAAPKQHALCDYCQFTETIPDLSITGNRFRWYQLEVAKRRLLYSLDSLDLPFGTKHSGFYYPLAFNFKADAIPIDGVWRRMEGTQKVYTGHSNGLITINVRETDDLEREKLRIDFGEYHRTLIGHFRHEIGHYFYHLLVENKLDAEFASTFGDPFNPPYAVALKQYYTPKSNLSPATWQWKFISRYATMHPWEDFAETFANYLDIISILAVSEGVGLSSHVPKSDFEALVSAYCKLGIALNELNRARGLLDLVPEVFTAPVTQKLEFVHQIIQNAPRS